MSQFHKLLALRLSFEGLNFLEYFLEQRDHIIVKKCENDDLVHTQFLFFFSERAYDFN